MGYFAECSDPAHTQVVKNDDLVDIGSTTVSSEDEEGDSVTLAPPAMTVTVSASDTLELSVTKTSLALFTKLGKVCTAGTLLISV